MGENRPMRLAEAFAILVRFKEALRSRGGRVADHCPNSARKPFLNVDDPMDILASTAETAAALRSYTANQLLHTTLEANRAHQYALEKYADRLTTEFQDVDRLLVRVDKNAFEMLINFSVGSRRAERSREGL